MCAGISVSRVVDVYAWMEGTMRIEEASPIFESVKMSHFDGSAVSVGISLTMRLASPEMAD